MLLESGVLLSALFIVAVFKPAVSACDQQMETEAAVTDRWSPGIFHLLTSCRLPSSSVQDDDDVVVAVLVDVATGRVMRSC